MLAIKDAIHSLVRELSESEEEKAEVAKKSEQEAADLKAQQEMSFWAEGMFYATIVQIVLSLVGIWFIWQTLKATWDAVNEANEATKAARSAVAITADTAERELRAYVLPIGARVLRLEAGEPMEVKVTLKNTGQTPAHDLRAWLRVCLADREEEDAFPRPGPELTMSEGIIGPSGETSLEASRGILDENRVAAIRAGQKILFAYGDLEYHDIIGRKRTGEFRFMYGGRFGAATDGRMGYAQGGNRHG